MPDLAAPPLASETELNRVHRALADAQADLQRHRAALLKLQGELSVSRLEVAGARTETAHYQIYLRTAQADIQAVLVHAEELRTIAVEREAEIARLDAELAAARKALETPAVLVSRAARFSRRVMARGLGAARVVAGVQGRLPQPAAPAEAPAATAAVDPNEQYTFKPAEASSEPSPDAQGTVSLDELYRLSRSL